MKISPKDESLDDKPFDFSAVDLEKADRVTLIAAGKELFKMVSWIVWRVRADALSQAANLNIKFDVGHNIKARFTPIYINACEIGDNIFVQHVNRTNCGMGGFKSEENHVLIELDGQKIFFGEWCWNTLNKQTLFIAQTSGAKAAFVAIQKNWAKMMADDICAAKDRN